MHNLDSLLFIVRPGKWQRRGSGRGGAVLKPEPGGGGGLKIPRAVLKGPGAGAGGCALVLLGACQAERMTTQTAEITRAGGAWGVRCTHSAWGARGGVLGGLGVLRPEDPDRQDSQRITKMAGGSAE